jgi:BASS family bile acid:Na+ symporter
MAPKSLLLGLFGQMIVLPLIAFAVSSLADIPPKLKVGIVILAACPGGTTSNLLTYLLNGRVGLSVSLTAVNSLITLISVPLIVNTALNVFLGVSADFRLPYGSTLMQIFLIIIIPALVGMTIKLKMPKLAEFLNSEISLPFVFLKNMKFNIIKPVVSLLLAIVFSIKIFADSNIGGSALLVSEIYELLPVMLIFHILSLLSGYFLARFLGFKNRIPMTIGIEVGLQNTALAFLVAGTLLQNTEMEKPAIVYAFFSFFTTLVFGLIARHFDTKRKKKSGIKYKFKKLG